MGGEVIITSDGNNVEGSAVESGPTGNVEGSAVESGPTGSTKARRTGVISASEYTRQSRGKLGVNKTQSGPVRKYGLSDTYFVRGYNSVLNSGVGRPDGVPRFARGDFWLVG